MNIVFASDIKYGEHLKVAILSLLSKTKYKQPIHFYILHEDLTKTIQIDIKYIIKYFNKKNSVKFILIDNSFCNRWPIYIDYITSITYARLGLSELIGSNIGKAEKLIYLDTDIIIQGDIADLWHINLQGKTIGACFDSYIYEEQSNHKVAIGLPPNAEYFNAGVLLIDFDRWKEKNVLQTAIKWTNSGQYFFKYQDQDILNAIFVNDNVLIDTRFNFMPKLKLLIDQNLPVVPVSKPTYPIVIHHLCGPEKPWNTSLPENKEYLYSREKAYTILPWYRKLIHIITISYIKVQKLKL